MGCFPENSQVTVPGGKRPIQDIRKGDLVLRPQGVKEFVQAAVRDVFESEEELLDLVTTHSTITTTADQLFQCYDGQYKKTQDLMAELIAYVLDDKEVVFIRVKAIIPKGVKAKVYHLHVDEPHLYIVDGFVVHNKGGGGSTSTSEASIAPELRPLFKQTGEQLQSLQKFRPGTFTGWSPFTGVGGVPYTAGQPGWGYPPGIFSFGYPSFQPGMPTTPGVEQPSFNAPPIRDPNMMYAMGAPGAFDESGGFRPTTATGSTTPVATPQTDLLKTIEARLGDTATPIDYSEGLETMRLAQQFGYVDPGSTNMEQSYALMRDFLRAQGAGAEGGSPSAPLVPPSSPPGFPGMPGTGLPPYPGPEGGGTPPLPGSVLDEFLFANPQIIPQASPGQLGILGRQQQRAFGEQMTPQEFIAQFGFGGAGQMRPGEEFATGLSSTFPFLRPEEGAAIGLGTGFGQLKDTERFGLGQSAGFGELRGPEGSALDSATRFSDFRMPEIAALLQANELTGGPIGSSPATQAGIAAITPRIQNEMAMAGLGRSGALPEALASAYGPIVAQEIAGRQAIIPQLAAMGQAQRQGDITGAGMFQRAGEAQRAGDEVSAQMFQRAGEAQRAGDITQASQLTNIANAARSGSVQAAQIQAQIAQAQRTGDLEGAARLAALGDQLVKRESTLLGEAATSEEALRELAAMQFQSFQQDMLRRQQIASQLTTGILGNFPSVTGTSTVSKTSGGGGGMMGKIILLPWLLAALMVGANYAQALL